MLSGMLSVHLSAVIVLHLLTVTVIGGDKHVTTSSTYSACHPSYTDIKRLYRLHCRIKDAGVPNHITIGIVDDNHIMLT